MRLGFCGLGQMGAPMAGRLVDAGHEVIVWNRTVAKTEPLVARGATRASTPREAATDVDAVFTILSDPEALAEVLFGGDGVIASATPTTVVEMSTVGPRCILDARRRLPDQFGLVDAPVFGTVPEATNGTLRIFVGVPVEDFTRWKPILSVLGHPVRIGDTGHAAAMKLVLNVTLKVLAVELGEALALGDAYGLDEHVMLDVLEGTPIGPTVVRCRPAEGGRSPTMFKLVLGEKDLRLVDEAADDTGLLFPVATAARSWYIDAEEAGLGELDYTAVIRHIRAGYRP